MSSQRSLMQQRARQWAQNLALWAQKRALRAQKLALLAQHRALREQKRALLAQHRALWARQWTLPKPLEIATTSDRLYLANRYCYYYFIIITAFIFARRVLITFFIVGMYNFYH